MDQTKIALLGMSLGGVLAARAAALEHRLAATVCNDGVADFGNLDLFKKLSDKGVNNEEQSISFMNNVQEPMVERWIVSHGLWSFKVKTWAEFHSEAQKMTMVGLGAKVQCPVFVGDAQADMFFKGQPQLLAKELGDKATLRTFTAADGAELHCHEGATRFANQVIFDWLDEKLGMN